MTGERRQDAALALSMMAGEGRIDEGEADLLWLDVVACGPELDRAPAGV